MFPVGWHWSNSTRDNARATLSVPTSGLHALNLWMREDGLYIDKIVVTTDPDYVPTGTGPAHNDGASLNESVNTTPVDTTPVDTTPVDTTPVDTTPVDTTPVDTTPVDTTPVDTRLLTQHLLTQHLLTQHLLIQRLLIRHLLIPAQQPPMGS